MGCTLFRRWIPVTATTAVVCLVLLTSGSWGVSEGDIDHSLPGWSGEASQEQLGMGTGHEEWRGEIIQLSWAPRAYLLKGFMTAEECDHLITVAAPSMTKSTVADNNTGKSRDSEIRTSTGTFLSKNQDDIITRIEKRVAQVTMIPEANQEGMQILHYKDGQKYEPHHDYFHDQYNKSPEKGGQRLATVLMYLTTVAEGGETVFPNADRKVSGPEWSECARHGLAVKAVRGDAVMFFSLHPDGSEDPTSLHGSCPTTRGEKWSATKWIHVGVTRASRAQQQAGWRAGSNPQPHAQAQSDCVDAESECEEWASAGECDANPVYMRQRCRKACRQC